MRILTLTAAIAVLFIFQTRATSQAVAGSIEGVVVRSENGEPVAGAQVTLKMIDATPIDPYGGTPVVDLATGRIISIGPSPVLEIAPATTDTNGTFLFKDLVPGTYRIYAVAKGYARQEYRQRNWNGVGTAVTLAADQVVKELSIGLTPVGTVVGRISDDQGKPAAGVPVQLLSVFYTQEGKKYAPIRTVKADDRGEYRLFDIAPGRYFINAGNGPGIDRIDLAAEAAGRSYESLFYPGVANIADATLVEIKSDTEARIDMTLRRDRMYSISGRLVDSATGKAPPIASISLKYRGVAGSGSRTSSNSYNSTAGTFEIRNVTPGQWFIQAQAFNPSPLVSGPPTDAEAALARDAALASWPTGQIAVEVKNTDIDGLVLSLSTGVSVVGRLKLDDDSPVSKLPDVSHIRVELRPSINGVIQPRLSRPSPASLAPDQNGKFRVEGVKEEEYAVQITEVPSDYYVKSVRYGALDMLNRSIRFTLPTSDDLEVVLRLGAAQLKGIVTDVTSIPLPGIQVALIPEQKLRLRTELFRTTLTNQKGEFVIVGIPPGDYRVFSWEALPSDWFFDSDLVKSNEEQGQSVHLSEGDKSNVVVTIIPAGE